jgi:fatty acid-binding protein DegV
MGKIAFITDSTAYLPYKLVEKHKIIVVPQVLIWGDKTYKDGEDITPEEFYARRKTDPTMPTASQVSVLTMENIFCDPIDRRFDVLGVSILTK